MNSGTQIKRNCWAIEGRIALVLRRAREPAFRGAQIYHALYAERNFDMGQITNLPLALRERLAREARVTLPEVKQRFSSSDGSVRYLLALASGDENLTVLLRWKRCSCRARGGRRFAFPRRPGVRWIAIFALRRSSG